MTSGGSGSKGHDFLRTIAQFAEANAKPSSANKPVKLGRVDYAYNPADFLGGVNPRILFDGESTVSQKRYQVMAGYYPLPGARVCLIPVGTTYLIIGSVENIPQDPKVEIFTSSDTWEKPPGARMIRVQVQGGGGAGGGTTATGASETSAGASGAGGSYGESWIPANAVGSSETVTVGSGGAGVSGSAGGSGGTSSFGSLVSAAGGGGGTVASASGSAVAIRGADASTTITADLAIPGGGGGGAHKSGTAGAYCGPGGSSVLGGGAAAEGVTTGLLAGENGNNYGGGGSGAVAGASEPASTGGNGAPGVVIVTTYF